MMALKRRLVHLDDDDMKTLAQLAKQLSRDTGLRVTTSGLIRQAVKAFLRTKGKRKALKVQVRELLK